MYLEDLNDFPNYKITKEGKIYKITKKGKLKEVSASIEKNYGFSRVNIENGSGKWGTYLVHRLVYKTFKGGYEGDLVFIDGNKQNCNLDNLITVKELLEFYNKNNTEK